MAAIFAILLSLFTSGLYSQSVLIENSVTDAFPECSCDMLIQGADGKVIAEPDAGELKIEDSDGSMCNILNIETSNKNYTDFALTVAFDKAIEPMSNPDRFLTARNMLRILFERMNSAGIPVALTSFDKKNYLLHPHTLDTDSLSAASLTLRKSESSFVSTIYNGSPISAGRISGHEKESFILLITDSYDAVESGDMLDEFKASGAKLFVLHLGKGMSKSLEDLAKETGGYAYKNIGRENLDPERLANLAEALLSGTEYSKVTYRSPILCDRKHNQKITYAGAASNNARIEFTDTYDKLPTLKAVNRKDGKPYVGFSAVRPGNESSIYVDIYAENGPVSIGDVYLVKGDEINIPENSDILTIIENDAPNELIDGAMFTVKVRYKPADSAMIATKLVIESNACVGNEIMVTAGYPSVPPKNASTIHITSPKKDDFFFAGDKTDIRWEGLLPEDMVHITLLARQNGEEVRIDSVEKVYGAYNSRYPAVTKDITFDRGVWDSCRLELIQWWPNKIGQTTVLQHEGAVNTAFFSNDNLSKYAVTASSDTTVKIWTANTGDLLKTIKDHTAAVNYAEFSHDNNYLLSASDDGTIRVYRHDINTGEITPANTFQMPDKVTVAKFSLNDDYIIAADMRANLSVWRIDDPNNPVYEDHIGGQYTYNIKSIDIHPKIDGLFMFSCYNSNVYFDNFLDGNDNTRLNVIDIRQELGKSGNSGSNIVDVPFCKFNDAGDKFAVISEPVIVNGQGVDKNVSVWNFSTSDYSYSEYALLDTTECGYANSVYFKSHPDLGNIMVVSNARNNIYIWDVDKKARHDDFSDNEAVHTQEVLSGVFNFDSWIILTSSLDSTARLWYRKNISVQVDTSDYFAIGLPEMHGVGINFGSVAAGYKNDTLGKAFITNKSRKEIKITNINLKDDEDGVYSLLPFDADKTFVLEPNESRDIALRFAPESAGFFPSRISFEYENNIPERFFESDTVPRTFDYTLDADGYTKELQPNSNAIEYDLVDFGLVEKGEIFAYSFDNIIENKSFAAIEIDTIIIEGYAKNEFIVRDFGINSFPYTIAPGDSLPLNIVFAPKEYGKKSASIYYLSDGMFNPVAVNLLGTGSPVISDSAVIRIDDIAGAPGERISLPIYLEKANLPKTIEKIEGFTGYLKFDRSMLAPVGDFETDSIDGDMRVIKIDLPKEADENGVLRTLEFDVALGKDTISPLTLEEFIPKGFAKITVVEKSARFNLTGYCTDGESPRLFDGDGKIELTGNSPNPAAVETTFEFKTAEKGVTLFFITATDGKHIETLVNEKLDPGTHQVKYNTSGLAPGKYFYTLETPTLRRTKSFVIER